MKHVENRIQLIDSGELTVKVYGSESPSADGSEYREIWFRDFDGKAGSTTIIQMPLSLYEKLEEAIEKGVEAMSEKQELLEFLDKQIDMVERMMMDFPHSRVKGKEEIKKFERLKEIVKGVNLLDKQATICEVRMGLFKVAVTHRGGENVAICPECESKLSPQDINVNRETGFYYCSVKCAATARKP